MSSQSSAINHQSSADPLKATRLSAPVRITDQVWPEGTVPVVSVFCITYNHVNFIRDAIEGFLMQETTFPVEIFIHDDASTDGTAEIVKEYAEKYPKLFWTILQTENQWSKGEVNLYFAKLMQKQRGEFIALCEGDDYWISKEKLQRQVEVFDYDSEIALVFHNCWEKHISSRNDRFFNANIEKNIFTLEDVITKNWFVATSSTMFRSSIKIREDLFEVSFGGDIVIIISAAISGKLFYIDRVWSIYNIHSGGLSWQFHNSKETIPKILYPRNIILNYSLLDYLKNKNDIDACWGIINHFLKEILCFAISNSYKKCKICKTELKQYLLEQLSLRLSASKRNELLSEQSDILIAAEKTLSQFILDYYIKEISCLSSNGFSMKLVKKIVEARRHQVLSSRYFIKHIIISIFTRFFS